jgi:hypothetical protein
VKGVYVPPARTPVHVDALREALKTQLTRRGVEASPHALNALLAMSAHETGQWRSCWNHNLGNVKAGPDWPGLYTCLSNVWEVIAGKTRWFSPGGETAGKGGPIVGNQYTTPPGHPQTRFRAYPSLLDGVEGWVIKMVTAYGKSTSILFGGGSTDEFIASLKAHRYFTGDLERYQASVRRFYAQFSGPEDGRRTLRRGMTGDDVKELQEALELAVDGEFGPVTEAAVKRVQASFGLTADGVVGPKTWVYVDKLIALGDLDLAAAVRAVLRG